jgi:hypothetical protein
MAIHGSKGIVGALIAGSLLFSSSAAMAAPTPAPQADPWAVLTAMSSGAPAAAMCGSAAAATTAQAAGGCVLPVVDAPPPVAAPAPPVEPVVATSEGIGVSPILIGLLAVAVGVGIYFAVRGNNNHGNSPA